MRFLSLLNTRRLWVSSLCPDTARLSVLCGGTEIFHSNSKSFGECQASPPSSVLWSITEKPLVLRTPCPVQAPQPRGLFLAWRVGSLGRGASSFWRLVRRARIQWLAPMTGKPCLLLALTSATNPAVGPKPVWLLPGCRVGPSPSL